MRLFWTLIVYGRMLLAKELPPLEKIAVLPRMCQGKIVLGGGTTTLERNVTYRGDAALIRGPMRECQRNDRFLPLKGMLLSRTDSTNSFPHVDVVSA